MYIGGGWGISICSSIKCVFLKVGFFFFLNKLHNLKGRLSVYRYGNYTFNKYFNKDTSFSDAPILFLS